MSPSALIERQPLICLRSFRRSLSPALQSRRLASSARDQPQNDRHDRHENAVPRPQRHLQKDGSKPRVGRTWTSTLNTKALGQTQSVLVLRDSEIKDRRRRVEQTRPQQEPTSIDSEAFARTLADFEDQTHKSTQEEANAELESLRNEFRRRHARRGTQAALPAAVFDDALNHLARTFSDKQLHGYLEANAPTVAQLKPLKKSRGRPASGTAPAAVDGIPLPSRSQGRRKMKSAERIMRGCWDFKILEELQQETKVDVEIPQAAARMLSQNMLDSVMDDIGRGFDVGLGVASSARAVSITGTRMQVDAAAASLSARLAGIKEEQISLQGLFDLRSGPDAIARYISDTYWKLGCGVHHEAGSVVVSLAKHYSENRANVQHSRSEYQP